MDSSISIVYKKQQIDKEQWHFIHSQNQNNIIGFTAGILYESGTYGKIYKSKRMVLEKRPDKAYNIIAGPEEIVVKRVIPEEPNEDKLHISEANLHILSWQAMQKTVTPWSIPKPYEIYGEQCGDSWTSLSFGMSYVEGEILQHYLAHNFCKDRELNSRLFKEILGQTAFILHNLQTTLSLNHRDLKVNNLIIRVGKPVILTIDSASIHTSTEVTLIDFGFACIGDCSGTLFQAGSWFPFSDICFKKGRDLAQLIYCINCYYPLELYLTPELFQTIKSLMQIKWSGGIANCLERMTKDGIPTHGCPCYDTGIYEFLRRVEVDPVLCEPANVFKAMSL